MATTYLTPGIYVEEVSGGPRPISAVGTSTAAFVGVAPDARARQNETVAVNSWTQFRREFVPEKATSTPLSQAVYGFFLNGGRRCWVVNVGEGGQLAGGRGKGGLDLLEAIDEIAIVAVPGYTEAASWEACLSHCEKLKDRVAVLDAPLEGADPEKLTRVALATPKRSSKKSSEEGEEDAGASGGGDGQRPRESKFGTVYFPWITLSDPLSGELVDVPPSGAMAGIWARSDATRGVHKAPANEPVRGALNLTYRLTHEEQGILNQAGVNCIRAFEAEGIRVWGARTLSADPEWRYLNVRRLFNMVEESIARSTRWIVFEPNDRTLWKSIERDIGAFLTRLWRDGALMGRTPAEAFFVMCNDETNPPEVIDEGRVVVMIGIAPVKPAEFIIFRISQFAGGFEVETEGESHA